MTLKMASAAILAQTSAFAVLSLAPAPCEATWATADIPRPNMITNMGRMSVSYLLPQRSTSPYRL